MTANSTPGHPLSTLSFSLTTDIQLDLQAFHDLWHRTWWFEKIKTTSVDRLSDPKSYLLFILSVAFQFRWFCFHNYWNIITCCRVREETVQALADRGLATLQSVWIRVGPPVTCPTITGRVFRRALWDRETVLFRTRSTASFFKESRWEE